jgi:hypothetical protein
MQFEGKWMFFENKIPSLRIEIGSVFISPFFQICHFVTQI